MKIDLKGVHTVRSKLANGTFGVYYYAWRGGPRLSGELGSPDFVKSFHDALEQRRKGSVSEKTLKSVTSAFKTWTEYTTRGPRTKADYLKIIDKIDDKFGTMPLSAFKPENARKLKGIFRKWRDEIAAKSERQADYHWTVLARILAVAMERGKVDCNPCTNGGRLYKSTRIDQIWSVDDEKRFLAACPTQFRLPFLLALYTGQREGDLLKMRFGKGIRGVARYNGVRLMLKTSKTGEYVAVRAVEPLKSMLDAAWKDGGNVLLTSRGKPWTTGFSSAFSGVKNDLGFDHLTFHDLRGSAVTRLRVAGCSVPQIAAITGHTEASAEAILNAHYMGGRQELAEQAITLLEVAKPTPNGTEVILQVNP